MNTTTALVASLSLMAPSPLWAQEATPETEPEVALICPDGSDLPCPEGVEPVPAPMDEAMDEAMEAETAEEPAAEAEAGAEVDAEAPEAEPVEAEASAETAAEAVTEEPAAARETAAEEAVEGEPAAEEVLPAETASDEPAEATEEAPAEMAEEEPVSDGVAEQTAGEPATEDSADEVAVEAEASPESGEAVSEADPAMETEAEAEADIAAEEVPDLPVQPDAASGEAPVAAAASAPEESAVEAEVTEEVVTEETARSSDEDFANKVNESAPKKKKKKKKASGGKAAADDDDGPSDGEKAVLLGLGAVAVGALLSNNRKVELNSGDRVVVTRDDGSYQIIKDDNALLRQPGSTVRTETFGDGSTRTTVTRADGSKIVTIRDAEYRVLRRAHVAPDGTETLLIDDTAMVEPVDITRLPPPAAQPVFSAEADEAELRAALAREAALDRRFSLAQVRDIAEVRALVPVIDLNAITFETGSAAIRPDQAQSLGRLGRLIQSYIDADPREVFLIEGHTDAVGSAAYNLALSDRRAESVALALTEYFAVPPENMVVQGYGEQFLKIDTQEDERLNRRASVRRITDLLRQAAAN